MRPVGSLLLGPVGDLLGRRTMLITSVLVMGSCSLLIGLLPAAPTWAPWAGYGLLALRMLQGLSVGGEYTGALTVVLENGESERRCWRAAVASAGSIVGFVAGAAAAALIYSRLPPAEVLAWGWRLPFLAGAAVALLAFWLRRVELPAEERGQLHSGPAALLAGLWQERGVVLRVMAALAFADVAFYMVLVFEPQLALERRPELAGAISTITAVNEAIGVALVLLGGWLSDRVGPQRCMRWGCILSGLALGQLLAVLPLMLVCGAFPALLPAQFAPAQRCTAFSLAYSLVVALVGGTAPLLASWMVLERGWGLAPGLYALLWLPACLWALRRFRGWEPSSVVG
jgi:MHS family proline/betaine transporter-like MFS transporter